MALVSTSPQPAPVLPLDQALEVVEQYGKKLSIPTTEAVSILSSLGRVLAEPILADRDFPPFPRSTRDGFAAKSADVQNVPTKLRVVGQIKAGGSFSRTLNSGEAVEIMTGASAPEGSDAVVMVEYTNRDGDDVEVLRGCVAGENIVPAGSEAKAGREMVAPGVRISFAHVAVAAAVAGRSLRFSNGPEWRFFPRAMRLWMPRRLPVDFRFATATATRWRRRSSPPAESRGSCRLPPTIRGLCAR